MKKLFLFLLLLLLVLSAIAAWIFLGPGTGFEASKKYLYIRPEAATKKAVMDSLLKNNIISNETAFNFLANQMNYWESIKPGKYEVRKGTSLLNLVKKLRNGSQEDIDLVITKLRLKEDFARLVGRKFATDSMQMMNFLNSSDSLERFGTEPEDVMAHILPDTYTYYWNASPSAIFAKLYEESNEFWNDERVNKARQLELTPLEVYTLASIIEEETTNHAEKDTIASVYLNRLKIGMPLQADPTLKFAVKDFSLKVIKGPILEVESPYNTYNNRGLPPGPICTPSRLTIDKVLNPANTNYLYFVAKPRLGGHLYSSNFEEHKKKAAEYRAADRIRQEKEKLENKKAGIQ